MTDLLLWLVSYFWLLVPLSVAGFVGLKYWIDRQS